ncbi:hypothetical protein P691DRAFT_782449 [Macrolepiota fuliginosa MF-IS2]|uniref:Uncharacterized protein n=1 Tax=Macrolepiota fuliginosa MF-IS2 TaxID=1400762 RepID=A0A9P5XCN8_9AGAR|nr:hypothetical protein P691DRAFT_782449 [Macrolepiota fuliginosa MF-IS2]
MHIGFVTLQFSFVLAACTNCFAAVSEFNFSLVEDGDLPWCLVSAIHYDWNTNVDQDFIHTHAVDEPADSQLFHHLSILANGNSIKPIDITCKEPPVPWLKGGLEPHMMGYVILGRGSKSCLVCLHQYDKIYLSLEAISLNAQFPPTTDQISKFRGWEKDVESRIGWPRGPHNQKGQEESDSSLADEAGLET